MAEAVRQALADAGVNPDRFGLDWASAAEAPRFVELVTGFVSRVKGLGPLGGAEGEPPKDVLVRRLAAAVKAADDRRVRTAIGTLARSFHKEGDYAPDRIREAVAQKVAPAFRQERVTQEIWLALSGEGPANVKHLVQKTGAAAEEIEKGLAALAKLGRVKEKGAKWTAA